MRRACISTLIFLVATISVHAQGILNTLQVGIYGNPQLNTHEANFILLPDVIGCNTCRWNNDFSVGVGGGVLAEMALEKSIGFSMRIGYAGLSGTLSNVQLKDMLVFDGASYDTVTLPVENRLAANIAVLSLSPSMYWTPVSSFPFHLSAGVTFDLPLKHSYDENMYLADGGEGYIFMTGHLLHNISAGEIPRSPSVIFGIHAGMTYDIFLTDALRFSYYIFYTRRFTNISDVPWKIHSITPGISLAYRLFETPR